MRTTEKQRIEKVLDILTAAYPQARVALRHEDPFQLLVAVILSAQCTDVRVNQVTPALFRRYPDAKAMAAAPLRDLEEIVRTTGFFRNKAKNIQGAARMIVERFGGRVPDSMDDILKLPGVARKTANIVLYNAYGVVAGIAVDTHVKRLSGRLGLSGSEDPVKIERDLMAVVPKGEWGRISYVLIEHGRAVCQARKPRCLQCPVKDLCPSAARFL